jgi:hypothetical protein
VVIVGVVGAIMYATREQNVNFGPVVDVGVDTGRSTR